MLVCNAGISGPKAEPESENATELKEALFKGESFQEWSDTYNTNVSAVYVSLVFRNFPHAKRYEDVGVPILTSVVHNCRLPSSATSRSRIIWPSLSLRDRHLLHVWHNASRTRSLFLQHRERSYRSPLQTHVLRVQESGYQSQ